MLKGCRKDTVMVKTEESKFFERPFLVLRESPPPAEGDMLAEALRLVERAERASVRKPKKRKPPAFSLGVFTGMAVFALLRLLFGW